MSKEKPREKRINVRIDASSANELIQICKQIDIPYSYIVREAVREKILSLKQTHPLLVGQVKTAQIDN